jgi:hypothetical protein
VITLDEAHVLKDAWIGHYDDLASAVLDALGVR